MTEDQAYLLIASICGIGLILSVALFFIGYQIEQLRYTISREQASLRTLIMGLEE